jgi:hypothetical protein
MMRQQKYLSYEEQSFSSYRREFLYLLAGTGAVITGLTGTGGALNTMMGSTGTTLGQIGQVAGSMAGGVATKVAGAIATANTTGKPINWSNTMDAGLGSGVTAMTNTVASDGSQSTNKTNPTPAAVGTLK